MASRAKEGWQTGKKIFEEFLKDDCMSMAAALAYYTVFSLPPLLVIVLVVAGLFAEPKAVERELEEQIGGAVGPEGIQQLRTMIENARDTGGGFVAAIVGAGVLAFGATGVVAQLQAALNRAWNVEPDPERSGAWNFISKRLLSFGMILGIAFLLLVSLVLHTLIAAFEGYVGGLLPGDAWQTLLMIVNFIVSFGVITLLFAAMFKVLPDAKITWKDVWVGAAFTALLFVIGKLLIGVYLGAADVGAAYGAAGSLVLILVWVYYSALILLVGAEFTQVWARRRGKQIEPAEGAVRTIQEKKHIRESDAERKREADFGF